MTTLLEQAQVTASEDAARRARFPLGAAITWADLEESAGTTALATLRAREPVSWVPAVGGWLVSSRSAARTVLLARDEVTVQAQQNLVRQSLGTMMLTTDAPEHARLRKPFEAPFKPGSIQETFAATIATVADELIDRFEPTGSTEVGSAFAAPFAVRMAAHMLGLSFTDTTQIDRIYAAFAGAMVYDGDPEPQRIADRARDELGEILHSELERCRREGSDSITALVAGNPGDLTDEEIVAQLRVILFGAVETVQASILTTLLLLLRHPAQLAAVREDPGLLANAGEEARRLVPPVCFAERWTRKPLLVQGVEIPANEFLVVSIVAANRDPETFDAPDAFDIHRSNTNRAMSFSFGEHACLGLHLARLESRIAVERVLTRFADLRLVDFTEPAGFAFRRPATLQLAWDR
jgi:cytochrome P450